MLGSQPNCPSGSTMATNQEHVGRTPQQAPLQAPCAEGQWPRKASTETQVKGPHYTST